MRRKGIATGQPQYAVSSAGVELTQLASISLADLRSASPATRPPELHQRLECELVGLTRAEQEMEWLKSQIDYLERRAASSIGATERELEDLITAREELAASAADVARLSSLLES
ncbi:MAG TPA: hypothetical protein VNS63_18535, partial [Blastocatellia bacterium]|nr:hypothetical protein [Blastocatellia bacterium]